MLAWVAAAWLPAAGAAAAQFAVIGSVGGAAQIGAVSGATVYGTIAASGDGVLFSITTDGRHRVLHRFNGGTDGSRPNARLALSFDGNLYGTASAGGVSGGGTLWEYTAAGVMQTDHAFGAGTDSTVPMQGPTLGKGGAVYGAASQGAIADSGNIFELRRRSGYDDRYDFVSMGDGHCPFSGVAVGHDGSVYGTTVGLGFGGNPNGSVWRYDGGPGVTTLYVFADGADGEWPTQAPVVDDKGNVYGTTAVQGGAAFAGVIWRITAAGVFSVLHVMDAAVDGSGPNSPLLRDKDGMLYGTNSGGGAGGAGTVFSITPEGSFAVVHSFAGGAPTGNLVRSKDGMIYGGTSTGQVFQITP